MKRAATQAEDCCTWCRRPIRQCTESSCDDAGTYRGTLVRGEWKDLEEADGGSRLALAA